MAKRRRTTRRTRTAKQIAAQKKATAASAAKRRARGKTTGKPTATRSTPAKAKPTVTTKVTTPTLKGKTSRARVYRSAAYVAAVAGGARFAASSASRRAAGTVAKSYVRGSFERNLEVGQGGAFKGVKAGAEFRTPSGRGVLVKGIVGYHGKPDRRFDVTPSLNKRARTMTVKVKPNTGRKVK